MGLLLCATLYLNLSMLELEFYLQTFLSIRLDGSTLSDKVLFLRDLIDVFVSGRCEIDLSRRKSHQSSEISRFNGSNSWR